MGEVWLAEHARRGTQVALKRVRRDTESIDAHKAFEREVAAIAGLHHPNIIRILDIGELQDSSWFVMEWARGGSARAHRPRDWDALQGLLRSVLAALAYTHAHGLVHLDLKPGNVLATEADAPQWLLADFGLARALRTNIDGERVRGTPPYMAPEQILDAKYPVGPAADLYALGCLAFELATGRAPFNSADPVEVMRSHVMASVPHLEPQFPVPKDFEGWTQALLAKRPSHRFLMAADAVVALDELTSSLVETNRQTRSDPTTARTTVLVDDITADLTSENVSSPIYRRTVVATADDWREASPKAWIDPLAPLQGRAVHLVRLRRAPLVGRESIRDALWDALRGPLPNRVDLVGPEGSGKSAVLTWFAARAEELGSAVAFHQHCDGPGWESELLDRVLPRTPRAIEDARETLQERLATIRRAVRAVAEERPVLVLLDGPDAVADALARALQRRKASPVLVVRASATTDAPDALVLEAMPDDDIRQLIAQHLELDPELVTNLTDQTGGRPGHVLDWIHHLTEQGSLTVSGSRLRRDDTTQVDLPAWHELLLQRARGLVEGAPPERRLALWIAAAVGIRLSPEQVQEAGIDVEPWVGPARPLDLTTDGGLQFSDPRLRQAILTDARSHESWPEVARIAAQVVETPWQRGRLLIDAGERQAGLALLAEQAHFDAADPGRARACQRELLPFLDELSHDQQSVYWRCVALERRSAGDMARVDEALNRALQIAEQAEDPTLLVMVHLDLFFVHGIQQGQIDAARTSLANARDAADRGTISDVAAGRLLECEAYLAFQAADWQVAVQRYEAALAQLKSDPVQVSYLMERLSRAHEQLGDLDRALEIVDRGLDSAGNRARSRTFLLTHRGALLVKMGRREEGLADLRASIQAQTRIDHHSLPVSWFLLASHLHDRPVEARDAAMTGLALANDLQETLWQQAGHAELLGPLALLGDWASFDEHLDACEGWLSFQGYNRLNARRVLERVLDYLPEAQSQRRQALSDLLQRLGEEAEGREPGDAGPQTKRMA